MYQLEFTFLDEIPEPVQPFAEPESEPWRAPVFADQYDRHTGMRTGKAAEIERLFNARKNSLTVQGYIQQRPVIAPVRYAAPGKREGLPLALGKFIPSVHRDDCRWVVLRFDTLKDMCSCWEHYASQFHIHRSSSPACFDIWTQELAQPDNPHSVSQEKFCLYV